MSLPLVPYWTIEALASDRPGGWNLHPDNIRAWIETGQLAIEVREMDGDQVRVVLAEEKQRFEVEVIGRAEPAEDHPELVKSALFLLGMGMHIWCAEDENILEGRGGGGYAMRDFLASDAEHVLGIIPAGSEKAQTLLRTRETDAGLMKMARDIFRSSGLYVPRAERERRAQVAQQSAKAQPESGGSAQVHKAA